MCSGVSFSVGYYTVEAVVAARRTLQVLLRTVRLGLSEIAG